MTFTLDAVAEPSHVPPRVVLTATESDTTKPMQSCQFYRDGVVLRADAVVTGFTALAYDYDATFEVPLLYRADATELPPLTSDWAEAWASLASWTETIGTEWTTTSGKATAALGLSVAAIRRDTSAALKRLVASGSAPAIALPAGTPTHPSGGTAYWSAGMTIILTDVATNTRVAELSFTRTRYATGSDVERIALLTPSGGSTNVLAAPTTFDLTVAEDSITAAGTGWSLTRDFAGTPTRVEVFASTSASGGWAGSATFALDDLTASIASGAGDTVAVTDDDTETLTPVGATRGAWLTNAANPGLALLIEGDCAVGHSPTEPYYIEGQTRKSTTSEGGTVQHEIEGSGDVVTVTTAPRKKEPWTLNIVCRTEEDRVALKALLADNAAINLRFLASQAFLGLPDGFYAVGPVPSEREEGPAVNEETVVSLPLTPSRGPVYKPRWQWNLGTLYQTGMTLGETRVTYPTLYDLLRGPT